MGLSQEQWFTKLKGWVPPWFFEQEDVQEAHFQAIAIVFSNLETVLENHITETYICQAEGDFVDEHGNERNLTRGIAELDITYCDRIRTLVNPSDPVSIKALVDSLLVQGEATIVEHEDNLSFASVNTYANRGNGFSEIWYDFFTIWVEQQIREPESFADREYFADREDVVGTHESSIQLFETIVEAVNKSKALGVLYRLIERV